MKYEIELIERRYEGPGMKSVYVAKQAKEVKDGIACQPQEVTKMDMNTIEIDQEFKAILVKQSRAQAGLMLQNKYHRLCMEYNILTGERTLEQQLRRINALLDYAKKEDVYIKEYGWMKRIMRGE